LRRGAGWAWLRGKAAGLAHWRELRGGLSPAPALAALLCASEAELRALAAGVEGDRYWRCYFALARSGRSAG
jgi:hypothetical protein